MTSYFRISHNTFGNRGMPWIQSIVDGLTDEDTCPACDQGQSQLGDLKVLMQDECASYWPDVLGCGAFPCFVISQRFVDNMRKDGICIELGGTVEILEPVENGLSLDESPTYFWIDGKKHHAAKMDFEASGYVDPRFCPECGSFSYNVGATADREHAVPPPPIVFDHNVESGHDLFTSDLSWTYFFCTDRILQSASRNGLTNIRFTRVEDGARGQAIKY